MYDHICILTNIYYTYTRHSQWNILYVPTICEEITPCLFNIVLKTMNIELILNK